MSSCSLTNQWAFQLQQKTPGPPVAPGTYIVTYTPTGRCLANNLVSSAPSSIVTLNPCDGTQIWEVDSKHRAIYRGDTISGPGGNPAYGYLVGMDGSCDGIFLSDLGQSDYVYPYFSQDGSIYLQTSTCTTRFIPKSDHTGLIPASSPTDANQFKWTFTSAVCPPLKNPVATGHYKISFVDEKTKKTLYLGKTGGNTALAALDIYDPAQSMWAYDSNTKILSTSCGSPTRYVFTVAAGQAGTVGLTTDIKEATPIVLSTDSLQINSSSSILPHYIIQSGSGNIKLIQSGSCLSKNALGGFTVQPAIITDKVTASAIENGYYKLEFRPTGYFVTGDGTLNKKESLAATWNYDNKTNTLRLGNDSTKCLSNSQVDHCSLANFFVGPCNDTKKTQRFMLTTSGQLYDPLLQSCIAFPTPSSSSSSSLLNNFASADPNRKTVISLPVLFFIIISIVVVVALVKTNKSK